jgi:hypothetical protein
MKIGSKNTLILDYLCVNNYFLSNLIYKTNFVSLFLQILLRRLLCVKNVVRSKPLLQVLLKLLLLCTKVRSNQELLASPQVGSIEVLLATAERCLSAGKAAEPRLTEQILAIMETILTLAADKPLDIFLQLTRTDKGAAHVHDLLQFVTAEVNMAIFNKFVLLFSVVHRVDRTVFNFYVVGTGFSKACLTCVFF